MQGHGVSNASIVQATCSLGLTVDLCDQHNYFVGLLKVSPAFTAAISTSFSRLAQEVNSILKGPLPNVTEVPRLTCTKTVALAG